MATNEGSLIALQVLDSEKWKEMKDDSSGFASDVETSLSKSMTSNSSCGDSHVVSNNRDAAAVGPWDEASLVAPDSLRWDASPADDLSFDVFDCNVGGRSEYGHKAEFERQQKPRPGYLTEYETGSRCEPADFHVRTLRSPRSSSSSSSTVKTMTACASAVTATTSGVGSAYSPSAKTSSPNLRSTILEEVVPNRFQRRTLKQSLAVSADEMKALTAYGASAKARLKHYVPLENDVGKAEAEFGFNLENPETIPMACQSGVQRCSRNSREGSFHQQQSPRHHREQELHTDLYTDRGQPTQQMRSASNEENELLSAGAIKMSERPFSRSESRTTDSDDDDLIEDYDVTIFNPQCVRNRSALEKFLAVILVLFLVVIIALAVALVRSKEPPGDPYCSTPACISAAGSILTAMDTTVDPCHNFYQYACGSWVRDNPIPENYVSWDRFQELSEKNLYRLKGLLETLSLMGPVEQKVKNFYNSCLLESDGFHQDIRKKTLSSLRLLIKQVGGWSFSDMDNTTTTTTTTTTTSSTTPANWRFQTALQNIHHLGVWPLFAITVDVDEMDSTKNIFKIGIGSNFMDPHIHPVSGTPENDTTLNGPLYSQFLSESFEKYMKETIRIMKLLAGKSVNVSSLAYRVSVMEKTLIQMKSTSSQESYNVSTIHDLTIRYPMINWMKYFTNLASIRHINIKSTDRVAILYPDYLSHLSVFLNDVKTNATKAETLRNYLIVSLIRSMLPFFEESNLEEEEKDSRKPLDSWKRCIFYTNKALGFATGAIYVRAAAKGKLIHDKIESLIKYIKEAFKAYILRKFWMDKHTKAAAAAKLDSMIEKVSYPSFMLNTTYLNNYYKQLDVVEGNWFQNLIRWKKFDLERMIGQLTEKPDRRRWISPPVTVSPFYSPIRNELFFPMALFHLPFFSEEGPQALNFGAIGSVIGHEITHAFGIRGMHYDGKGQLRNWWDPETAKKFNITTQCVRRTYSSYKVENLNVDGDMTLDENIADNGGLRAAYVAYLLWTEEHGEEKPLPGINLTPAQLFYVSFAQMYCSGWTKEGIWHHILTDHFAPGKARVIGAISNSRAFSSVFDCPFTSEMNPSTKCEVW